MTAVILLSACTQTGSLENSLSGQGNSAAQIASSAADSSSAVSASSPSSGESDFSAEVSSGTDASSLLDQLSSAVQQAASSVQSTAPAPVESKTAAASKAPSATSKAPSVTSKAPSVTSKAPSTASKAQTTQTTPGNTIVPTAGTYTGAISIRLPFAPGTTVYTDGESTIDASNTSQGYVMFRTDYSRGARLKLQIKASATYNYDIEPGIWYTFPLQMGSGSYEIKVMENTTGTMYHKLYGETLSVSLESSLLPYLYPNQYVNYTASSAAVKKSFDLCVNAKSEAQKVAAIYNYVTTHIKYDSAKASSVTSGYLPNVDSILASGRGICFDYAALTAAMLRAQGIPTKLAIGTKGSLNHAWNYIYMKETGWIAVQISFSGGKWNFTDTTFAAGGIVPTESGYATLRVY